MSNEVKEISEELKKEYFIATKPQGDWRQFVNIVIQRYELATNSLYGHVLYDWLDDKGLIKHTGINYEEISRKAGGNLNRTKSFLMDEIIARKILTIDQIKATLNT